MTGRRMERTCPHCKRVIDGHLNTDSRSEQVDPRPGDVSVCIFCKQLSVFTEDGMRRATMDEKMEILQQNPSLGALLSSLGGE